MRRWVTGIVCIGLILCLESPGRAATPAQALCNAAEKGDLAQVKHLIRKYPHLLRPQAYKDGWTPLHSVSVRKDHISGRKAVVTWLLAKGMDINAPTALITDEALRSRWEFGGFTPLHKAVENAGGDPTFPAFLIQHGANVNAPDGFGWTPIFRVLLHCHEVNVMPIVRLLVARGANLRARDPRGNTPLHQAACNSEADQAAAWLIDKGAEVNAKNEAGWTPLHMVAHRGFLKVARVLVAKGADLNRKDSSLDLTPLHLASTRGPVSMVIFLIDKGADVNSKNREGITPLHFAASNSDEQVAALLIVKGAQVNVQEEINGATPLHIAAMGGCKENVRVLLHQGADGTLKDKWGRTPLDYALERNHDEVATLLRQHDKHYY